jgi:hypothetical protein
MDDEGGFGRHRAASRRERSGQYAELMLLDMLTAKPGTALADFISG